MTDEVFSPAFAVLSSTDITVEAARSWTSSLFRDPRLLVPIDVRALVVPAGAAIDVADVSTALHEHDGTKAAPFTDAKRAPGVHVHWALPDGLTRGQTGNVSDDPGTQLRPLPDRWIVVRLSGGVPRTLRAWILESDTGISTPSAAYPPAAPGTRTHIDAAKLTAVAGGDPAWAAVYDNVVDRFAFHDPAGDLEGAASEPLTYVVAGWYAQAHLDPLASADDIGALDRILTELGWSADDPDLKTAMTEARQRRTAAEKMRLKTRRRVEVGNVSTIRVGKTTVTVPNTSLPVNRMVGRGVVSSVLNAWWPQQCLFHGALFGVRRDGNGDDERPAAGSIDLGIGATGAEALAALVGASAGGAVSGAGQRLVTAFAYGVIASLGAQDGVAALDQAVHAHGFGSLPGGVAAEPDVIREPTPPQAGRRDRVAPDLRVKAPRGADLEAAGRYFSVSAVENALDARNNSVWENSIVASGFDARRIIEAIEDQRGDPLPAARTRNVDRPLPRFVLPNDPAFALQGVARSFRHGYDDRFNADGTLSCRVSGEPISGYTSLLRGDDVVPSVAHGGVPDEVDQVVREAALLDVHAAPKMAKFAAERTGIAEDVVTGRLAAELTVSREIRNPSSSVADVLPASIKEGVEPSPVATTHWTQPWVPLYAEWELTCAIDDRMERWTLGELDLDATNPDGAETALVRGRSLLTGGSAKTFADQLARFLSEERARDAADRGIIDATTAGTLATMAANAAYLDVLSGSCAGLRDYLLGFDEEHAVDAARPVPARLPRIARGGLAQLTRLRVVDAFGRTVELSQTKLTAATVAESIATVVPAARRPAVLLRPRINRKARLLFRFLSAADDAHDARIDQTLPTGVSPVAAWLLPDHVDHALEMFDADGAPLGQLMHAPIGGGVVWEGAPGRPGALGAPPDLGATSTARHARGFVRALVEADAMRRDTTNEDESPLSALLRAIDTTAWTIDPFGQKGSEHVSTLTGHPIALVRASLELEVPDDLDEIASGITPDAVEARRRAFTELASLAFPVRLGLLTRTDDGLLGYFVDDDYTRFHPVSGDVLAHARDSGPRRGQLGTPGQTVGVPDERAIVSSYMVADPYVEVRRAHRVMLTLLLDPGGKVHATSGILPRKELALARDWIAKPLSVLRPSFRIGPVLVDPQTIRMPRVSGLAKEQVWTRRDTPTSWRDDPIAAADQQARLPDRRAVAQEGYIRVELPGTQPGGTS
jgi:hypothetical protein